MRSTVGIAAVVMCVLNMGAAHFFTSGEKSGGSADLLKEALDTTGKITDKNSRERLIGKVAGMQAMTGDGAGAKVTVETITTPGTKQAACATLAAVLAGKGDLRAAKEFYDQGGPEQPTIGERVVQAIAAAGGQDDAVDIAAGIKESSAKSAAYGYIARAQTVAKQWGKAQKAIDAIDPSQPSIKMRAMVDVAVIEAQAGKTTEAQQTLKAVDDLAKASKLDNDPSFWIMVSDAMARMGDTKGAKELLSKARKDYSETDIMLSHIATAQEEAGKLEEAAQTVGQIEGKGFKVAAYPELAIAFAKSNKKTEAQKWLDQSLSTLKEISMPALAANFCLAIGEASARVNGVPAAAAWARTLPDPEMSVNALLGVVRATPEFHDPLKP